MDLDRLQRKALAAAAARRTSRRSASGPEALASGDRSGPRAARSSLQAAIENAGGIYLPDRLHEVRIAVKKLRYALEIARELSRSRASAPHPDAQAAQDLLGRMHDLEVLIMRIRALQGSDRAPALKVSADLDRLVRRLETECRQLHVRYMGFKVEVTRALRLC